MNKRKFLELNNLIKHFEEIPRKHQKPLQIQKTQCNLEWKHNKKMESIIKNRHSQFMQSLRNYHLLYLNKLKEKSSFPKVKMEWDQFL